MGQTRGISSYGKRLLFYEESGEILSDRKGSAGGKSIPCRGNSSAEALREKCTERGRKEARIAGAVGDETPELQGLGAVTVPEIDH